MPSLLRASAFDPAWMGWWTLRSRVGPPANHSPRRDYLHIALLFGSQWRSNSQVQHVHLFAKWWTADGVYWRAVLGSSEPKSRCCRIAWGHGQHCNVVCKRPLTCKGKVSEIGFSSHSVCVDAPVVPQPRLGTALWSMEDGLTQGKQRNQATSRLWVQTSPHVRLYLDWSLRSLGTARHSK
jgi:hypothetical protein